ncbi:MAG: response regulator [Planctomycetota bacterium]|nr:MAG: response regulator [Planctomycetota bacterium]
MSDRTTEPPIDMTSINGPDPAATSDKSERAGILIVDDQEGNLRVLEGLLEDLGADIVSAHSGTDALSRLLERDFAVILLDVRMPIMDGFETAELIRKRRRSRHIPIIFVTAISDDVEQIAKGYAVGAVDYIMKPLNGDILRSKIRVFMELYQKGRELASKSEELTLKNTALEKEIRKRERVERILAKSRDFYLALFDEFPTLVWRTDEDGKITYFNRSWLAFVGRTLEQEKQGGWDQGLHSEDREKCVARYDAAFQSREPFEMEYRHRRKDGEYRWILNCGRPYRNLDGSFAGFIGSCYDITPRRKSEEETRAANAELEAFSYTVSHDLRAPLRSMAGFCQILLEDYVGKQGIDRDWQEYVERISQASKQMDALIRDLLAFSRLARDKVDMTPIETGPLLKEVVSSMRLDGNPVTVVGPSPVVMGNRVLLSQVFSNLIGNGLKFVTEGNEPKVVIRTEEGQDGWIRTWVEDNGIGIAPEYHDKIFQVFERLNEASTYPGTGIGLAIVRRAVGRMGGRVGVVSEEGKGSRFWVELPRAGAPVHPLSQAGSTT